MAWCVACWNWLLCQLVRAACYMVKSWHHTGSLNLAMVGVFTPQELQMLQSKNFFFLIKKPNFRHVSAQPCRKVPDNVTHSGSSPSLNVLFSLSASPPVP